MTLFDILTLIIVAGGAWMGRRQGLVRQVGSVAGFLLGFILCRVFAQPLAGHFTQPGDDVQTRLLTTVMTYAVLFMGSWVGLRMCSGMLRGLVRTLHIGPVDRVLGAVFKALEWLLLFSLALNLWIMVMPDSRLRTSHQGMQQAIVDFAPALLGSQTAQEVVRAADRATRALEQKTDTVPQGQAPSPEQRDAPRHRQAVKPLEHR